MQPIQNTMNLLDPSPKPLTVTRVLIDQVIRAARGRDPRSVTTIISRPLWDLFCAEMGMTGDPTDWTDGFGDVRRVYGSETIISAGTEPFAVSF